MAKHFMRRSVTDSQACYGVAVAVAILVVGSGCDRPQPTATTATTTPNCSATDTSTPCLLVAGKTALNEVGTDANWTSAASEYAEALSANGKEAEAAAILELAVERAEGIEDTEKRARVLIEVAAALVHIDSDPEALRVVETGEQLALSIDSEDKRVDLSGKFLAIRAGAGQVDNALTLAMELPHSSSTQAALKARTLGEIAVYQAKKGEFEKVRETLASITMGMTYYQSTARSDAALSALRAGRDDLAEVLLQEAEAIALAQDNGYFVAGAVRNVGVTYALNGNDTRAMPLFEAAKKAARTAATPQERARALSRVATKLADCQHYARALEIFSEAKELAAREEKEMMRHYAFYEVAGAAAFSGDFETAFALLEEVPATPFGAAASLKSATERDIVWGLTRHGKLDEALKLARAIETPRERVQALSRMIRLLEDPEMEALARYL